MRIKNEIWKPILGYEGLYEVSSLDRVRIKKPRYHRVSDGIMKPATVKGYHKIVLINGDTRKNFSVHRLIGAAFIPNPDNKPCINHIDGDRLNNIVSNLEWCTYSENELHAIRVLGKAPSGAISAKLAPSQVQEIRRKLQAGHKGTTIAMSYGVDKSLVYQIGKRKIWKNVAGL